MYLAKYEGKRRRTKDIDAATQFARYGDNLDNAEESPDEVAGAEPKDAGKRRRTKRRRTKRRRTKDTEHENDDRDVSHDGDKDEYENDDRAGHPDDREGEIDAKNDDRDKSDATPKYRILELLRKSAK